MLASVVVRSGSAADGGVKRVGIEIPLRTILIVAFVVAVAAALVSIADALLLVFLGIFLGLVFDLPVRAMMRRTGLGRGTSATIIVLGATAVVAVAALLLLVPLVASLRDFLKDLPQIVDQLRESDELSWLGDSGAAENVQSGAEEASSEVPDTVAALLGLVGEAFGVAVSLFTVVFLALFLIVDMPRMQSALSSYLMPDQSERWLDVWERITQTVSRWAVGALTIAVIAGVIQGTTAWIVGSSYALALGLIAGVLDLVPMIGATIAGFILVPAVLAEEGLVPALIMLAVILVYQQLENNLLTPTIQGKAVEISAFFIILGVTLGGALVGPLGALVAVPVIGSLQIVVQVITAERRAAVAEARAAPQ
jgi:predicted PurR-regulated permease PerM